MSAERFEMELRRLVETGDAAIEKFYAPDVIYAAYLPGETVNTSGVERAAAALHRNHSEPVEIVGWATKEFGAPATGMRIDVDWPGQRRVHHIHFSGDLVVRHVVFSDRPNAPTLPIGDAGPALQRLYDRAIERPAVPSGTSGSAMQQISTSDGTFFVKFFAPNQDWQARITEDAGREAMLFRDGWLDRLPPPIGHPILTVERYGVGWVTISRDVTRYLLRTRMLTIEEMRRFIAGLDAMYRAFPSGDLPTGLVPLDQRWGLLWPRAVHQERDQPDAFLKAVARGWDLLDEVVDEDLAALVRTIVNDPRRITRRLATRFLHGDVSPANVALHGSRIVLFDWSLATAGPAESEGAWLANFAQFYQFTIDELLALWRSVRASAHDETAFGLCLLGQAAGLIPALATSVLDYPDPAHREFSRQKLDWWISTARRLELLLD